MNPLVIFDLADRIVRRLEQSPAVPVDRRDAPVARQEVIQELKPTLEHLTNNEPIWRSRVSWGAFFAILGGIATIGTAAANGETSIEVYTTAGMSIMGGATTLYGRWKAKKPLGT